MQLVSHKLKCVCSLCRGLELNSVAGRPSGRFLQRCRIKKPREYQAEDKDSLFYLSPDFYVGAIVRLNDHVFLLTEADDYVFAFMEREDERERFAFGIWS